ncbi:MAG: TIGR00159 family protein [SAR324 cluster bacterium]|nr:TIGR00159 family protein [SAR324 cluster bacterium]MBL7036151.1 TIGR00159 family protein [SAR324 cluster bacterium]
METLLPIFSGNFSLRWQDLFDIVLLSLIFYRILLLIRGTRTIPMLMGFVLLLALYLVSLIMNLEATQLLLDNLGQSLVLVLVVLFQTDIRNGLAQIGVFTLFRENSQQKRDLVESILHACLQMTELRIGALIVLEQEVGLKNFSDRGTLINGTVSEQLLLSIFNPASPLHDGAVIISNKGELLAAQCILPVSMNSRLSSALGTRHRAAIGLTEETDAAVLIVSEERKEISLSYRGQLIRGKNEDIRKALLDVLAGNIPEAIRAKETKDTFRKSKLKQTRQNSTAAANLKKEDKPPPESN